MNDEINKAIKHLYGTTDYLRKYLDQGDIDTALKMAQGIRELAEEIELMLKGGN